MSNPSPTAEAAPNVSTGNPARKKALGAVGEDTDDVLSELGYAKAEVRALRERGVV